LALTLSLVVAPNVDGQDQLGTGRGLEKNLQVGGPVNTTRLGPDVTARNNLITGNVTGLSYFRGTLDYRASNTLSVGAGSDTLFRFRARSASLTPTAGTQPRSGFFRSYATQPGQQQQQQAFSESMTHTQVAPTPTNAYRPYDSYRDLRAVAVPSVRLGQRLRPDGSVIETTASPLLGIRDRTYDPTTGLGLLNPISAVGLQLDGADEASLGRKLIDDTGPHLGPHQADPIWKPSLDLGRHLDINLLPAQPGAPAVQQQIGQIHAGMMQRLEASRAKGPDVYTDLMAQFERYWNIASAKKPKAPATTTNVLSPEALSKLPGMPAPVLPLVDAPSSGVLPVELEMPTGDQLRDAAAKREQALREALGLPAQIESLDTHVNQDLAEQVAQYRQRIIRDGIAQPMQTLTGEKPYRLDLSPTPQKNVVDPAAVDLAAEADAQAALEQMLRALEFRSPSLKTLAGNQQIRMNRLLEEAEGHVTEGRYFEAEDAYSMVLKGMPGHPMARVGRIHAQIGAGLIRSASANLRELFEQHPELIATRYEANLLPATARLRRARVDLEKVIQLTDRSEPALLLAYLGYQMGPRALVVYSLDLAEARSPLDPLVGLLRRLWLGQAQSVPSSASSPDSVEATPVDPGATGSSNDGAAPKSSK